MTGERVAALRCRNPAAVDLATLCSLAVRVEPGLLRRLRLLLPEADVTAESDLWASDLLAGAGVRGLALDPAVAEELRRDLAQPRWAELRNQARRWVSAYHREVDWSLRLEEDVAWLAVAGGPDAEDRITQLILAAVARLTSTGSGPDDPARVGIARWLLGALARLPRSVTATEAAGVARLGAAVHLDAGVPGQGSEAAGEQWLPWLLATAGTASHDIPVRFTPGRLHVNTPASDAVTVTLPTTDPLVLDVDCWDGRRPYTARLRFREDEAVTFDVAGDEVELTTLAGDRFRVLLPHARHRMNRGGFDFAAVRRRCRPCLGREGYLRELAEAVPVSGCVVLTGSPGVGKTVLAGALADRFERDGWLVAQHFYGVEPSWDDDELVAASIEAQLAGRTGGAGTPRDRVSRAVAAATRAGRRVLLLLDGVTWRAHGSATRTPDDLPLPRKPEPGVCVLVTTREGDVIRQSWLLPFEPTQFNLDGGDNGGVCAAIFARNRAALRVAFGADLDGQNAPDPGELTVLAGGNPGRMAGIVAWALSQPVASVRLERIPPTITASREEVLRGLEEEFSSTSVAGWLGAIAVAGPGFTVADAERLGSHGEFLARVSELGIVTVSGPLDDRLSEVRAVHDGLVEALAEHFGPTVAAQGHAAHNGATWLGGVAWASPYQVANAVNHAVGAGDVAKAIQWCSSVPFLDRRAREGGVTALVDDLRRVAETSTQKEMIALYQAARTVAPVAAANPDWLLSLLANEQLRRRSPATLDTIFAPALVLQRVVDLGGSAMSLVSDISVDRVVGTGPDGSAVVVGTGVRVIRPGRLEGSRFPNSIICASVVGGDIVAVDGNSLYRDGPVAAPLLRYDLPIRPVNRLGAGPGWVAVASPAGTIAVSPSPIDPTGGWRTLTGHGGAVTAIVRSGDLLLSASADGTVRVWSLETGQCIGVAHHHRGPVRHLLVMEDGSAVSAGDDGRVVWWEPATLRIRRTFRGHDGPVTVLARAGPGVVLTAGRDGAVWRDDDRLVGGRAAITHLALQPSGRFVTAEESGWLVWWDREGRPVGEQRTDALGVIHGLFPTDPAGNSVLVVHANGVVTFDPPTSPVDESDRAAGLLAVAGRRAYVATPSLPLTAVDLDRGAVETLKEPPPRAITAVGETLVVAERESGLQSRGPDITVATRLSQDAYELLAPSPPREFLAVRAASAEVEQRRADAAAPVQTWPAPHPATTIAAMPVVTLGSANASVLLGLSVDELAVVLWQHLGWHVPVSTSSRDVDRIFSDALVSGRLDELVSAAYRLRTELALEVGTTQVVVGDPNGDVTVVSVRPPLRAETGSAPVTALAAEVGRVLIGTADGAVLRWQPGIDSPELIGRHDGSVRALAVVRPGYVLSAGDDRTLRLWDVAAGTLHDIVAGREPFTAVAATTDGATVVARHGSGELWTLAIRPEALADPAETLEPLQHVAIQAGWRGFGLSQVSLWLELTASPAVPVEVRAVRLVAGDLTPAGAALVEFGEGGFPSVDEVGRLQWPLQLADGDEFQIGFRQEFLVTEPQAAALEAVLQLVIVTPTHRHERVWEARLRFEVDLVVTPEEAQQKYLVERSGSMVGDPDVRVAGLLPRPRQPAQANS